MKKQHSSLNRRNFLKAGAITAGGLVASGLTTKSIFADKKEITVMYGQPWTLAADMLAEAFKKETGVKVNNVIVPLGSVYQQVALDQQSGANRFDAFMNWYPSIGALAENGLAQDLTDLIERDKAEIQPEDYIQSLYDPYTLVNGRRHSLPFDGDSHCLYYNREIFDKLKVEPPKTWDEMNELTRHITGELKGEGIYGHALIGMTVPLLNISTFSNRVVNYGGRYLTEDGKPNLLSPEIMAAAENIRAIAPYCSPTPVEIGYTEGLNLFLAGKAAMTEGWTDLGINANHDKDSRIKDKWGISLMPTSTGKIADARGGLNAGWGMAMSEGTEKAELTWEFIKFATGKRMAEILMSTNGTAVDPYRSSGLHSKAYTNRVGKDAHGVIVQTFERAVPWPTVPEAPQMLEILSTELGSMLSGQKTSKEMLTQVQRSWERLIG